MNGLFTDKSTLRLELYTSLGAVKPSTLMSKNAHNNKSSRFDKILSHQVNVHGQICQICQSKISMVQLMILMNFRLVRSLNIAEPI